MPRRSREKYENSIYHIMVKGNNDQAIFLDDNDRIQYLKTLRRYKEKYKLDIYGYCLMTNHIHLLIHDNGQDISKVMQGLNLSYVIYFNRTHGQKGHLFQDRFKSILVKDDGYFIRVSRYIHLNPVKANMVKAAKDYKWSSYNIYLGEEDSWGIIDNKPVLNYFSRDYQKSMRLYEEYISDQDVDDEIATTIESGHMGVSHREAAKRVDPEQVMQVLINHFNIHRLDIVKRNNRKYSIERCISIYITSLASRMAYKELAGIFYVKAPAIGESIKKAIELIIENVTISGMVDSILKQIA